MKRLFFAAVITCGCASAQPRVTVLKGPRLEVTGTRLGAFDVGRGGARVVVNARIVDGDSEAWHCPQVIVEWPDDTTTKHEEDCEPWPAEGPKSWSWHRVYPEGDFVTRVCLMKAGHLIACGTLETHVGGGGGE